MRALEYLQVFGPVPDAAFLAPLLDDKAAEVRASAALLLGKQPWRKAAAPLTMALADADPMVQRRACESLLRAGIGNRGAVVADSEIPAKLIAVMDGPDRFARYAARETLTRVDRPLWANLIFATGPVSRPRAAFEGTLALIQTAKTPADSDEIFNRLAAFQLSAMNDEQTLAYARLCQLAFLRDARKQDSRDREGFKTALGAWALKRFPSVGSQAAPDAAPNAAPQIARELELLLAYCETPGAIPILLARLAPELPREDQIHAAYGLRAMKRNWTREERDRFVAWFDQAREFRGGASLSGYIEEIWKDALANLPTDEEREAAEQRKTNQLAERAKKAEALTAGAEGVPGPGVGELARMSFEELADSLEFDPTTDVKADADRGRLVFNRAKCASCHVFGDEGKGGGPDLSHVVKRFRRREILEAIMFPSKVVSDQYRAVNIDTMDNDVVSGFIGGETDEAITLVAANGDRLEIAKTNIKDRRPSNVSMMPEGLLDGMSMSDLGDLFLFLERGAGV